MNVLIITWSNDNESIAQVSKAIESQGGKAYRFDSDLYPTQLMMSAGYTNHQRTLRLKSPQYEIDLINDVDAIWYRRLRLGKQIPKDLEQQLYNASINESKKTFMGMLGSLQKFTLDPYHQVRYASNKQMQLQMALELGLEVPKTLFTNDAAAVRRFYHETNAPLITKMQHSFAVYENGQEQVVFTNEIDETHLNDLEGLDFCPMTFQEKIEKALELRVTIVGQEVFVASIDSQVSKLAETDWRRDGAGLTAHWQMYELPEHIKKLLLQMMDKLGLNYGAADVIVTPDQRYVFLEVNPVGEFFWLDKLFDGGISRAIANVLLDQGGRRSSNFAWKY